MSTKQNNKILPQNTAPHLPRGGISVFLAVVIVLQLLFFLLHFMIYETLFAAFGIGGTWLAVLLFLLSLTFVAASLIAAKWKGFAVRLFYRVAGTWFAFVGPLCGACFGFVVIEDLFPFAGIVLTPSLAGYISFGVAAAVASYGIWNNIRIQVTRVQVSLPNLPAFWSGKKIVFISDIHLGDLWGRGTAEKIVRITNRLAPEAVFIGGDLFDGVKCDVDDLLSPFSLLRSPFGTYAITGNHEYIRDAEVFISAIRRSNIKLLTMEKIDLNGLQVIGIDYKHVEKRESFAAALRGLPIDKSQPSILLKHVPEFLGAAADTGISLALCGHTHHGQFWPISLITRRVYAGYDYGLKKNKDMLVYTSSGVGGWMAPFRFGTRSEIVEITLIKR
ncbi:MAG: metallophosphoesterase [Patescibacteria group bacterium]|nr:metallophosphoesterase [Patescibacteria group bacterium]